jgi:hypothetical protein
VKPLRAKRGESCAAQVQQKSGSANGSDPGAAAHPFAKLDFCPYPRLAFKEYDLHVVIAFGLLRSHWLSVVLGRQPVALGHISERVRKL